MTGLAGFMLLLFDVVGGPRHGTTILLLSWLAMVLVFVGAMGVAALHLRRVARQCDEPTGDVFLDLARLESGGALREMVLRTHRLERASLALPLVVLSLVMPLSLHFLFSLAFLEVGDFNTWIVISLVIVGHAHLTLGVLSVLHVIHLRREIDAGQPVVGAARGFRAVLWTTLASTMPGLFLLCVPPPMVFVTGVVFVPWAFAWAAHRARIEWLRLVQLGLPVPVAEPFTRDEARAPSLQNTTE